MQHRHINDVVWTEMTETGMTNMCVSKLFITKSLYTNDWTKPRPAFQTSMYLVIMRIRALHVSHVGWIPWSQNSATQINLTLVPLIAATPATEHRFVVQAQPLNFMVQLSSAQACWHATEQLFVTETAMTNCSASENDRLSWRSRMKASTPMGLVLPIRGGSTLFTS